MLELTRYFDPSYLDLCYACGHQVSLEPAGETLRAEFHGQLAPIMENLHRQVGDDLAVAGLSMHAVATLLDQGPVITRPEAEVCRRLAQTDIMMSVADFRTPFPVMGVELPEAVVGPDLHPALTLVHRPDAHWIVIVTHSRRQPHVYHTVLGDHPNYPPTIEELLQLRYPGMPIEGDEEIALLDQAPRIALGLCLMASIKEFDLTRLPPRIERNRSSRDPRIRRLARRHARVLGIRELDLILRWRDRHPRPPATALGQPQGAQFRRGHFKRIACGPRHSQHRLGWVEPYWTKGGPDGESPRPITILS